MKVNLLILILFMCSCSKQKVKSNTDLVTTVHQSDSASVFIKYTIPQGHQYCDQSAYMSTSYSTMKFSVRFDSTAIYYCSDPVNQMDINKLYGFSDNNSDHHSFSARFGWRWSNGALRLFGYTYNNSVRDFRELGTVSIGSINQCAIKITEHSYVFQLNGRVDSMARLSTTPLAIGYKLFPYFGGDEVSPHDINIWIKED